MKVELEAYSLADPVFFDTPARWRSDDSQFQIMAIPVPAGWRRVEKDIWVNLVPDGYAMPEQGWKIHVSAGLDNASTVLEKVWRYCLDNRVAFKFLSSPNAHRATCLKYAPRASSGKLAAIYPLDERALEAILTELSAVLAGEPGPYILSDLRIGDGPLYVRYGGFVSRFCTDADGTLQYAMTKPDGTLVPDLRRAVFEVPPWVSVPDGLRPHLEARAAAGRMDWGYQVERALHFSNGGGVYVARRRSDGRRVVLKEARPMAGLDHKGRDAVARLEAEAAALRRLAGIPGIPEIFDEMVVWEHHFLAMRYLPGQTLHAWVAKEYPYTRQDPQPGEVGAYTERVLAIIARVERIVTAMHDRGVVFGDLHPANILVDDHDQVSLLDFEVTSDVCDNQPPTIGYPGFVARDRRGADRDQYALQALRLWAFMPLTTLTSLAPGKVEPLVAEAERRFELPVGYGDRIRAGLATAPRDTSLAATAPVSFAEADLPWNELRASLVAGLLAGATPHRADRLFPGDPRQFTLDALNVAYGAAGVLWTLATVGADRQPQLEQWLLDAIRRGDLPRAGLYDGTAGIGYVLETLGHGAEADDLMARTLESAPRVRDVSVFSGLAGLGLCLLHFAGRRQPEEYLTTALAVAERLLAAVESGEPHGVDVRRLPGSTAHTDAGSNGGLLRGWSGVALFLIRLYEGLAARGIEDRALLAGATRALHRDLDLCLPMPDGSSQVGGGFRALPYLEIGSAGVLLAAAALLEHETDDRVSATLPALAMACRPEFVAEPQLGNGRAGLMATLREVSEGRAGDRLRAAGLDPARDAARHLRLLDWHAFGYGGGTVFPGDALGRISLDFATGTAGVLAAVSCLRAGTEFLPLSRGIQAVRP